MSHGLRYLGIDLAWGLGSNEKAANESGLVALEPDGTIVSADWATGLDEVVAWVREQATDNCLLFVDAPLVVNNAAGMRLCEREVARRYGRWKVAANASNRGSAFGAGVALRETLEADGWHYDDGTQGPRETGRRMSECYPFTALVGAFEFGYVRDTEDRLGQRPRYKRKPKHLVAAEWRPIRAATCDFLINRFSKFSSAAPPIDLSTHSDTAALVGEPSPSRSGEYKHREDLLDAAICAWTAALWQTAADRCQILGADDNLLDDAKRRATTIAPRVLEPGRVSKFERSPFLVEPTISAAPIGSPSVAPSATPPARTQSQTSSGKLNFGAAETFIAAIPTGCWSSYGDVAAAAGAPKGAQALGTWLRNLAKPLPLMYRVLRSNGEIGGGWNPSDPTMPATRDDVHNLLAREGVPFDPETSRALASARWNGPSN